MEPDQLLTAPAEQYFSADYAAARERFLRAAEPVGEVLGLPLDVLGPRGEPLAIDIAWIGSPAPSRALVHTSGMHGIEGFAGSAIQLALLQQPVAVPPDAALVLVHALNPYGMAWLRRVNENNVDLNRNFLAAGESYAGAPAAYHRVAGLLNPPTPPRVDFFFLRAALLAFRYGFKSLKQAIVAGQYEYPKGLFYGGQRLEPGPSRYREWLAERLRPASRLFAIDVHTGLGNWCQESLFLRRSGVDPAELGAKLGRHLVGDPSEEGVGYRIRGGYAGAFDALAPGVETHLIIQEFGAYPGVRVLHALREENRWHHYGAGSPDHRVKARLKETFCPRSPQWRQFVLERGVSLARAVMQELFR
jgi:hypothetical protein